MNKMIIILLTACWSASLFAGAWVQDEGHGLNILTYRRYISKQFWTSGGRLQGSPTYSKTELDEFFEFGATKKLTLGLYFSGLKSHTAAAGTQSGSYDHLLLARYLLWKSDWSALSIQAYADKLGSAVNFNIPPNNSHFNSNEAILFGTSGRLSPKSRHFWFVSSSLGLVQRFVAGNQLEVNFEGGIKLNDNRLLLYLQNYNTFNLDHPNYPQGSHYNLMTIAPSIVFWVTKPIGVQVGMTQDFFGQNVGKGRALVVASWIQL